MGDSRKNNWKIWRATKDSQVGFMVTPKAAIIKGSKSNTIQIDDTGVYIGNGGPVSFNTTSENIRAGGFFIKMNDFVRMIPTTIMTPIPPSIPMPPLSLPLMVASELPFFLAMLG